MRSPGQLQHALTAGFLPEHFPREIAHVPGSSPAAPIKAPETPESILKAAMGLLLTGHEKVPPGTIPRVPRMYFENVSVSLMRHGASSNDLRQFFRWDHCARLLFNDWTARPPKVIERLTRELDDYEDRFFEASVLMVATGLKAETVDSAFEGNELPTDADLLNLLAVGLEGINAIRHTHVPLASRLSLLDLEKEVSDVRLTSGSPEMHLSRSAITRWYPYGPGPKTQCA